MLAKKPCLSLLIVVIKICQIRGRGPTFWVGASLLVMALAVAVVLTTLTSSSSSSRISTVFPYGAVSDCSAEREVEVSSGSSGVVTRWCLWRRVDRRNRYRGWGRVNSEPEVQPLLLLRWKGPLSTHHFSFDSSWWSVCNLCKFCKLCAISQTLKNTFPDYIDVKLVLTVEAGVKCALVWGTQHRRDQGQTIRLASWLR